MLYLITIDFLDNVHGMCSEDILKSTSLEMQKSDVIMQEENDGMLFIIQRKYGIEQL